MKFLKAVLISVYVILLLLVLLPRLDNYWGRSQHARVFEELVEDPTKDPTKDPAEDDLIDRAEDIGGRGALKVTLLWNFSADLDLHVIEPNGTEIYFRNKKDIETGGYLDVDNMDGGRGSAENIYWENPPAGEYMVEVEYYKAKENVVRKGPCQVVVFKGNEEPVVYNLEMKTVGQRELVARIEIE